MQKKCCNVKFGTSLNEGGGGALPQEPQQGEKRLASIPVLDPVAYHTPP
jgi:hypothetical protein